MARRLRQGESLQKITEYLIREHPRGLKRSQIQERLTSDLGIGQSTGGVNRQLKKLRAMELARWDQDTYTYMLPEDHDSLNYFIRACEGFRLTTDESYFFSLDLASAVGEDTRSDIYDCVGARYDEEMAENLLALRGESVEKNISCYEDIVEFMRRHNSYVRARLFKAANHCFLEDLSSIRSGEDAETLRRKYAGNIESLSHNVAGERDRVFTVRKTLMERLRDGKLPARVRFLIRFALNHVRPSQVYDSHI